MALSILRNCVKTPRNFFNKGGWSIVNGEKMEMAKNMVNTCKCAPLVPVAAFQYNYLTVRCYGKHAERKYKSESDSDSDLEMLGHRGESEFWRRKIRTFHGILDVNKDGVISYDDFKLLADRFVNLGHMSDKHAKEFQNCISHLWEQLWGEITPYNLVTVEQYLEDMHHVLNDKDLVKKAHSFLPYLFKALDKDKSGTITVEEFKLFFDCLGQQEADAILAFRAIDSNGDGKITSKEFVKHGREFFFTEDENKISKYFWGPLVDH